eukprot:1673694-Rhodomonas_salina.1
MMNRGGGERECETLFCNGTAFVETAGLTANGRLIPSHFRSGSPGRSERTQGSVEGKSEGKGRRLCLTQGSKRAMGPWSAQNMREPSTAKAQQKHQKLQRQQQQQQQHIMSDPSMDRGVKKLFGAYTEEDEEGERILSEQQLLNMLSDFSVAPELVDDDELSAALAGA